jgi:ATP-dependent helicase HepA
MVAKTVAADFEDRDLHRFLERPGFNAGHLKRMVAAATTSADTQSQVLKQAAKAAAAAALATDIDRLVDLQKLNDHVRPEEVALAREQLAQTEAALDQARLRLDSLRLIVAGVVDSG